MQVGAELGSQWNCVIAPPDIALYGVLCGLAHFDRSELKRDIIDNVQFREYLEVYPEVRSHESGLWDNPDTSVPAVFLQIFCRATLKNVGWLVRRHLACASLGLKRLKMNGGARS